jgi:hypothetical protein
MRTLCSYCIKKLKTTTAENRRQFLLQFAVVKISICVCLGIVNYRIMSIGTHVLIACCAHTQSIVLRITKQKRNMNVMVDDLYSFHDALRKVQSASELYTQDVCAAKCKLHTGK